MKSTAKLLLLIALFGFPHNFHAAPAPTPEPNIDIKGYYSSDKVQRGRVVRAAAVMEIPGGYHVNANRPLGKYAIPTTIKIEAPQCGVVGPIAFPRALIRKLKAMNNESLAGHGGRASIRFIVR